MFPDRVLIRKECLRERFVDDDYRIAPLDVTAFDAAPAEQPDPHRLEVTTGDRAEERDRRDRAWRDRPALNDYRVAAHTDDSERQAGRC